MRCDKFGLGLWGFRAAAVAKVLVATVVDIVAFFFQQTGLLRSRKNGLIANWSK